MTGLILNHRLESILAGLAHRDGTGAAPLSSMDPAVLANLAVHDDDLLEWAKSVALSLPIVCTSTTRPTTGLVAGITEILETDTGNSLRYYGPTTFWQPSPWNVPWGTVDEWESSSNVTAIGATEKALVAGTAVTLPENRLYRLEGWARTFSDPSAAVQPEAIGFRIKDGATVLAEGVADSVQQSLGAEPPQVTARRTSRTAGTSRVAAQAITPGAHTFSLAAIRLSGAGTFTVDAGYPLVLSIEDVGADGPPILT